MKDHSLFLRWLELYPRVMPLFGGTRVNFQQKPNRVKGRMMRGLYWVHLCVAMQEAKERIEDGQ